MIANTSTHVEQQILHAFIIFIITWHTFNLGAQDFQPAQKSMQNMPTVDFNTRMTRGIGYLRKLLCYDMKHMSAGSGEKSSGPRLLLEVRQLEQNMMHFRFCLP